MQRFTMLSTESFLSERCIDNSLCLKFFTTFFRLVINPKKTSSFSYLLFLSFSSNLPLISFDLPKSTLFSSTLSLLTRFVTLFVNCYLSQPHLALLFVFLLPILLCYTFLVLLTLVSFFRLTRKSYVLG